MNDRHVKHIIATQAVILAALAELMYSLSLPADTQSAVNMIENQLRRAHHLLKEMQTEKPHAEDHTVDDCFSHPTPRPR